MSSPATVCVDDNLSAGKTGVTLGTANDELSGGLNLMRVSGDGAEQGRLRIATHVIDGLLVKVVGRNDLLDDLLLDLLSQQLGGNRLAVLGADDDGVHSKRNNGTVVVLVLDGHLGLGVWSEPWQAAVTSCSRHSSVKLVCQLEGQGEEFWGLVGGISEHDTLVTSAEFLQCLIVVQTLGNIWGLLLDGDQDVASLVVEALGGVIVSDILDGISDDLLVIETGLGCDLAEDHHHTGLGGRLASDLGEGVILQAGIEDGIRDLIRNLVGVAFSYRLGLGGESAQTTGSRRKGG